jgi:hypothetical protein
MSHPLRAEIRSTRRSNHFALGVALAFLMPIGLLCSNRGVADSCDAPLTAVIEAVEHVLGSRSAEGVAAILEERGPDDIRWVQSEMNLIREACSRGSDVEAVWRLERVQLRMKLPTNWRPMTVARGNTPSG